MDRIATNEMVGQRLLFVEFNVAGGKAALTYLFASR
jgi:hypothetical protein